MIKNTNKAKALVKTDVCALHEQDTRCKLEEKFENTNFGIRKQILQRVIFPEGASPLWAVWNPEPLVRRKVVYREVCTKGSETAKSGTDEQERHKRHLIEDKQPQHCDVRSIPNRLDVDAAGTGGRKKLLPGEVLTITSWLSQEVSRSHSTWGNEVSRETV